MDNKLNVEEILYKIIQQSRSLALSANTIDGILRDNRNMPEQLLLLEIVTQGMESELHEFNIWLSQIKKKVEDK